MEEKDGREDLLQALALMKGGQEFRQRYEPVIDVLKSRREATVTVLCDLVIKLKRQLDNHKDAAKLVEESVGCWDKFKNEYRGLKQKQWELEQENKTLRLKIERYEGPAGSRSRPTSTSAWSNASPSLSLSPPSGSFPAGDDKGGGEPGQGHGGQRQDPECPDISSSSSSSPSVILQDNNNGSRRTGFGTSSSSIYSSRGTTSFGGGRISMPPMSMTGQLDRNRDDNNGNGNRSYRYNGNSTIPHFGGGGMGMGEVGDNSANNVSSLRGGFVGKENNAKGKGTNNEAYQSSRGGGGLDSTSSEHTVMSPFPSQSQSSRNYGGYGGPLTNNPYDNLDPTYYNPTQFFRRQSTQPVRRPRGGKRGGGGGRGRRNAATTVEDGEEYTPKPKKKRTRKAKEPAIQIIHVNDDEEMQIGGNGNTTTGTSISASTSLIRNAKEQSTSNHHQASTANAKDGDGDKDESLEKSYFDFTSTFLDTGMDP